MRAIRRIRVIHRNQEEIIGEAALSEDGSLDVIIKDPIFVEQLFTIFGTGEATSLSISPSIIPVVPAAKTETHNDQTLNKVYAALADCELPYHKIIEAITSMQNAGILFRERVKESE